MADIIATNPANGKLCQGSAGRQGDVRRLKASGRMWMRAVARITPAAKDLIAKKRSCSGWRKATERPRMGMRTPTAPAARMETRAIDLRERGLSSISSLEVGRHWQVVEREWMGSGKKRRKKTK
ncbi:hypothetical protein MA16_Dca027008 [Dendrobium catenatum]|uniref:Uncharacterized protein n=1 Tax=Dendrobium catenatum TaxID=906689 RepID=A0A2I0WXY5_9ASPA|nr:hypothetical protein MA16_Dca027008 [Dendrobium catenatum]